MITIDAAPAPGRPGPRPGARADASDPAGFAAALESALGGERSADPSAADQTREETTGTRSDGPPGSAGRESPAGPAGHQAPATLPVAPGAPPGPVLDDTSAAGSRPPGDAAAFPATLVHGSLTGRGGAQVAAPAGGLAGAPGVGAVGVGAVGAVDGLTVAGGALDADGGHGAVAATGGTPVPVAGGGTDPAVTGPGAPGPTAAPASAAAGVPGRAGDGNQPTVAPRAPFAAAVPGDASGDPPAGGVTATAVVPAGSLPALSSAHSPAAGRSDGTPTPQGVAVPMGAVQGAGTPAAAGPGAAAPVPVVVGPYPVDGLGPVAGILAGRLRAGAGSHTLVVQISPAALGPVRVSATLRNGSLAIELSGGGDSVREALRSSLVDLAASLSGVGIEAAVSFGETRPSDAGGTRDGGPAPDLSGQDGSGAGRGGDPSRRADDTAGTAPPESPGPVTAPAPPRPGTASRIDVRI